MIRILFLRTSTSFFKFWFSLIRFCEVPTAFSTSEYCLWSSTNWCNLFKFISFSLFYCSSWARRSHTKSFCSLSSFWSSLFEECSASCIEDPKNVLLQLNSLGPRCCMIIFSWNSKLSGSDFEVKLDSVISRIGGHYVSWAGICASCPFYAVTY